MNPLAKNDSADTQDRKPNDKGPIAACQPGGPEGRKHLQHRRQELKLELNVEAEFPLKLHHPYICEAIDGRRGCQREDEQRQPRFREPVRGDRRRRLR